MKSKIINSKGFTLVELLVVIAIIVGVSALSIPVGMRMINTAKETVASSAMKEVTAAIGAYKEDYFAVPVGITLSPEYALTSAQDPASQTAAVATNNFDTFIAALTGEETGNQRRKPYLKMDDCESPDDANCREGITRDGGGIPHGILDPWGNPYFIQLDTDLDNSVTVNINPVITGTDHHDEIINVTSSYAYMICGGRDQKIEKKETDVTSTNR